MCVSVSDCFFSVCESVLIVPVRVGFLCWCVLFPVGEKEFCVLVSVCFLCQWQVSWNECLSTCNHGDFIICCM